MTETSKTYKPSHGGYPGTVEEQSESKSIADIEALLEPVGWEEPKPWFCLTCGLRMTGWGNNPYPINSDPSLEDREVCGDCNAIYVIPARLGHEVTGTLYDTKGKAVGKFWWATPWASEAVK